MTSNVRALSIAGPFAALLADGIKQVELRSWTTNYRGLVLLHSSAGKGWEGTFEIWGMPPEECPPQAIVGAATLVDCVAYTTATKWERDMDRHCWLGDEPYSEIRRTYYNGKPPIGHVFKEPIFFEQPILQVPGALNYWKPKNERQRSGFERAITYLQEVSATA